MRAAVARVRLGGMNVIFGVAFAALIIGAVVVQLWPAIAALSGGAAAFLGALVGAAAGLGAILAGALYNAKLNRDENKRLRREEARALAAALCAEMITLQYLAERALSKMEEWSESGEPIPVDAVTALDIAKQTVFESVADKLGLLGEGLTLDVVAPHAVAGKIRKNVEGLKNQAIEDTFPDDAISIFRSDYEDVRKTAKQAADALDGFIYRGL